MAFDSRLETKGDELSLLKMEWTATDAEDHFTERCSGSETGSYLRLIDSLAPYPKP